MSIDVVYTSCSVNQVCSAAHWGKNQLICFANSHAVRIYDPVFGSGGKIVHTLYAHNAYVNSTRWLTGKRFENELISASADGKIIVWSKVGEDFIPSVVAECKTNVLVADGYYKNPETGHCIFIASTSNGFINVYERSTTGDITTIQSISLGKHIGMTLKFSRLPVTNIILFGVATNTGLVILFTENEDGTFQKHRPVDAHKDWIRGLDFAYDGSDLIFATASQDSLLNVWRIQMVETLDTTLKIDDIIRKNVRFKVNDVGFLITLDAILHGHDSWIYSVNFNQQKLEMLTTSVDKTMIIWHKAEDSNVWIEKDHFGEIGTSTLGYMGGMFGPNGEIFAHGFYGSFHIWTYSNETNQWKPSVTISGHANEVVDLAWEPNGQFIYSLSRDKTTRIHAPWTKNNKHTTWHEIARSQIHGYEMSCLALLSRYEYAAGAEEKVVRIFKAPRNFIENFKRICSNVEDFEIDNEDHSPQGAALPSLGLSNKAVYEGQIDSFENNSDTGSHYVPLLLEEPPTEEDLLQNTLWPETHKLYGHGYEIFTMAATHDGTILATACKATSKEYACILLWDTSSWRQIDKLESHNLTVTQLAFSQNTKHLLSVSRDRRWTVFSFDATSGKYKLNATTDSRSGIHTRIIWCCAWLPNSEYFATGSRDGKVVIWKENTNCCEVIGRYASAGSFLNLKGQSITAVACAPVYVQNSVLLAIGLESGIIHLYLWNEQSDIDQWQLFLTISQRDAHHQTVKRLMFRSKVGQAGCNSSDNNIIQLASCGSDRVVKVFNVNL